MSNKDKKMKVEMIQDLSGMPDLGTVVETTPERAKRWIDRGYAKCAEPHSVEAECAHFETKEQERAEAAKLKAYAKKAGRDKEDAEFKKAYPNYGKDKAAAAKEDEEAKAELDKKAKADDKAKADAQKKAAAAEKDKADAQAKEDKKDIASDKKDQAAADKQAKADADAKAVDEAKAAAQAKKDAENGDE